MLFLKATQTVIDWIFYQKIAYVWILQTISTHDCITYRTIFWRLAFSASQAVTYSYLLSKKAGRPGCTSHARQFKLYAVNYGQFQHITSNLGKGFFSSWVASLSALFGSCSFWFVLFLGHALFGSCPFWFVFFMVHALIGSCSFWFVLFLVCALFGSCCFWFVFFLVCALFGSCSFWFLLFWVHVLFGSCSFWFVLIFGSCSFWFVLFLVCVLFGFNSYPFYFVLFLTRALFGLCSFRFLLFLVCALFCSRSFWLVCCFWFVFF